MNIALISPTPIPARTANSIQVMKMAQAIAQTDHGLRVFAPGADPCVDWQSLAQQYGLMAKLDITWLPAWSALRRYDYAWRALREAQAWGADLIYTRLPQGATLAARSGMPTIFELHDMPSGGMGPRLLRGFMRGPGARRIVVNTKFLEDQVRRHYGGSEKLLLVAPNGVDLRRYEKLLTPKQARKRIGQPEGFTVGYSGHLYQGRGIGFMLELARQLPQMQFLFVGGRPVDVASRQRQARELPNAHFTGFVPNAELPLYQAACDVLLLPYRQQVAGSGGGDIAPYTNPLKMFEYLAARRPIVASDLPILREVLNSKNAIMLPSGDKEAWTEALNKLQKSPRQRKTLSVAAQTTARHYTWQKRAERILHGLQR